MARGEGVEAWEEWVEGEWEEIQAYSYVMNKSWAIIGMMMNKAHHREHSQWYCYSIVW